MSESMKRTFLVSLGLMFLIVGGALASPARITLHLPPKASGTTPSDVERVARIQRAVDQLAGAIGERNDQRADSLFAAQAWCTAELQAAGLTPSAVRVGPVASNIIGERGEVGGRPIVIVGAHLDTAVGTPGADDNASGVAAVLELARNASLGGGAHHIRYVLFAHEEPPHFQTDMMGSRRYARELHETGAVVAAMYSIESVGYYSDESGSQSWPAGLGFIMPRKGNFVMFVANPSSSRLLQDSLRRFRAASTLLSVGAAVPGALPGVDWSDHAEFWRLDMPALMVTDMPTYRNPNYHRPTDTPDNVSAAKIAAVVDGMEAVLKGFDAP